MPRKKDSEYLILQLLVTDLCYVIILDRVDKIMINIDENNIFDCAVFYLNK